MNRETFKTSFQEFVYVRTYSRWVDEIGRRESWKETVTRYCAFMKEKLGDKISDKEFKDVFNAIYNLEVMPSMRALWSAGNAANQDNFAIYNCLARETEFITSNGVKSFNDFKDGDNVVVLTKEGEWKNAVVKNFGKQNLNKIIIGQGGRGLDHVIYATENHNWHLLDGTITNSLKEADQLLFAPKAEYFDFDSAGPLEKLYWCYGYVFGDGTKIKDTNGEYKYSGVRLCGEDAIKYSYRFIELGFTTTQFDSLSGDFFAFVGSYLKTLPDLKREPISKIKAFVDGLLCADGHKNFSELGYKRYKNICATGKEINEFLNKALPMCGFYITRQADLSGQETNFGVRKENTILTTISDNHRQQSNSIWKVRSIERNVRFEDVWCLVVEDNHNFTLPCGIVTGNCSFTTIERLKDFAEMLYILMHGTGVGFSVERKYVNNLPVIKEKNQNKSVKIVFEDSKMGWAKGFENVLNCLWEGTTFECDYSKVRPRGSRLKTFGGRASGPEPLKALIEFVTDIVEKNRGFQLQPIDVHDICCKIAEVVVVGGVRRSALISLSDLTDNQMANAKMGDFYKIHPQRQLSNNSVAYTRKPDIVSFIDEWKNLYRSKSGERGIFNRIAAQKKASENHRRDGSKIIGTNPCLTGDTIVAVADGRNGVSIKQLADEGQEFIVYSAKEIKFSNQFGESNRFKNFKSEMKKAKAFKSGTKQIIEILLSDGSSFKCTPDHLIATKDGRWIEAQYTEGEQLAKFYSFTNLNSNRQYRTINSITDGHNRQYRLIWEFYNGQYNGNNFNVDHIDEDTTNDDISNLQLLSLNEHIEKSANSKLGEKNPIFKMDIDYRRWINKKRNILANGKKYGWSDDKTKGALEVFLINNPKPEFCDDNVYFNENVYVTEVIYNDEIEDVYDLIVEDNHNFYIITKTDDECYFNCSGVLVHNCGEIVMRNKSLCNLTEVIVRPTDDFNSLKRKIQIAATIGTWQASLTCFKFVDSDWKINCNEEALLGLSLSGVCDNPVLGTVNDTAKKWLSDLKHVAIQTNKKIAQKIGINRAAAITCVKPSGTVSQLVDCAPGIHSRLTATGYYIRRIRISVMDPLYRLLNDAGVPMKCEVGQTPDNANTYVVEFACAAPKETVKGQRTAQQQLEFWNMYYQFWCEHNPSSTIYVEEHEWLETAAWVYKHFDSIGGLTFLPASDHVYQLAPFEDIDKETYEEMIKDFPKIDFNKLIEYEKDDQTTGSKEYACTGDSCSIR